MTIDSTGHHVYAVNEIDEFSGQKSGSISAFSVEKQTGKLNLLDRVSSAGTGPCYVVTDKTGKYLLVANYAGGSVAVLPVHQDGSLGDAVSFVQHSGSGPKPNQSMPRAHSIGVAADDRFAIVTDLALDELISYPFDEKSGSLNAKNAHALKLTRGSGPRHFVFHPTRNFGYVITEMESTISVFSYSPADGGLRTVQTVSSLPEGFAGVNNAAEVQVHPSGEFLYASNRGDDSIAVFAVDPNSGLLKLIEHVSAKGKSPRHFAMDEDGRYLIVADQDSNQLVVFRVNRHTGRLSFAGQIASVPSPVAVQFVPVKAH